MKTVKALVGDSAIKTDRCCGESGTLAVSRPDISTQVRFRKTEELAKNSAAIRADGYEGEVKMLTSCPSCLQGLSRYEGETGMEADYIVVEMARSEEHTSELQSLMRISYAVFCLKKKHTHHIQMYNSYR